MAFPDEKPKKASLLMAPALDEADDATTEDDEGASDVDAAAGEMFDALVSKDREGFILAVKAVKAC
jgi:hypothetical protein